MLVMLLLVVVVMVGVGRCDISLRCSNKTSKVGCRFNYISERSKY